MRYGGGWGLLALWTTGEYIVCTGPVLPQMRRVYPTIEGPSAASTEAFDTTPSKDACSLDSGNEKGATLLAAELHCSCWVYPLTPRPTNYALQGLIAELEIAIGNK